MNKTYKISNLPIKLSIDAEKSDIINGQIVYGENVFTGNVELTADQIRAIIKDNPELLEEKKGGRYFFPKKGESYFIPGIDGGWEYERTEHESHVFQIQFGVYRTEQEATLASNKQKAIVACWKWQQENAPFEPDLVNGMSKYHSEYNSEYQHDIKDYFVDASYRSKPQFTLPYFKSQEDCIAFIEANKAHLELLFTK